jgi:hypothetical protein
MLREMTSVGKVLVSLLVLGKEPFLAVGWRGVAMTSRIANALSVA